MKLKTISKNGLARFGNSVVLILIAVAGICAEGPIKLPTFTLPDLDGKEWNSSQFIGNPVIVDFWATWCTTCKETIPQLAELSKKYQGQGLVVIGISVDKGNGEKIRKAAKKMGINYLVLHDKQNTMAKAFGYSGIPSVYVFNRKGVLTKAMPGFDPDQETQLAEATLQSL